MRDCIDALLGLLQSPQAEGEIVNIGSPHEISMIQLAERVKLIVGSSSEIVIVPYDQAYPEGGFEDMRRRVPCICKISRLTGWSPETSIDEMITRTIGSARERLLPAGVLRGSGQRNWPTGGGDRTSGELEEQPVGASTGVRDSLGGP